MAKKKLKTYYVQQIVQYTVEAESPDAAWQKFYDLRDKGEPPDEIVDTTLHDENMDFIE